MIITVFGATGQVGKRIVRQALARGYSVRAFGRNIISLIDEDIRNEKLEAIQGYVFDEDSVLNAVASADAIISTLGGAFDGSDRTRSMGIKNIITQCKKASITRIIVLGGLGVLDDADGKFLLYAPDYPVEFLPVGREHLQAYLYLKESGLDWTFVCAPNILDEDGQQSYTTNITNPPLLNTFNVTAGDIAHAMLTALDEKKFIQQKVGICSVD
jgi:uncharacterized protein